MLNPTRWNSTVYGKPRLSLTWCTFATIGDVRTSKKNSWKFGVNGSFGNG